MEYSLPVGRSFVHGSVYDQCVFAFENNLRTHASRVTRNLDPNQDIVPGANKVHEEGEE